MLLQLEGPDGAGKSTLSVNLLKKWRDISPAHEAILIHTGPPGTWNDDDMSLADWRRYCFLRLKGVIDMIEPHDHRKLLVMDRGTWGSPVYGKLYRPDVNEDGFGDLGQKYFVMLENLIRDKGGLTAHISPPLETILSRSIGREDEYLDNVAGANAREKQLTDIYNEYYSFIETHRELLVSYTGSGVFTSSKLISRLPGYQDFISNADKTGNQNNG